MALIAHTISGSADGNTVTTAAIDTTGANLIVLAVSEYDSLNPVSDSEGNTWTPLGGLGVGFFASIEFLYCLSPTTSATHTFSVTPVPTGKRPSIAASAWSNVIAYETDSGQDATSGTSMSSDDVTPAAGWLVLSAACVENTDTLAVGAPMTILGQVPYGVGLNASLAHAYAIAPDATPIDADWSWTNSTGVRSTIVCAFSMSDPPPQVRTSYIFGEDGDISGLSRVVMMNLDGTTRDLSDTAYEGSVPIGGNVTLFEQAAPPAGIAGTARLYAEDNGSGKTRLMVQFPTGSAVQIAIEP